MTCLVVRRRLSAYLDGELEGAELGRVAAHLRECAACATRDRELRRTVDLLADLPRLSGPDLAGRVLNRLEVEQRGPGLNLIFRPRSDARPLMVPSLFPAALLVLAVLGGVLGLDQLRSEDDWPAARTAWGALMPDTGTEAFPLSPSDVRLPQVQGDAIVDEDGYREVGGEGTFFLETVVARDGSVSAVTLLTGDSVQARPIVDALRRERFEPARFQGRPVAVSVYRLISRLEVRPPRI
jgi:hypothetical protein